MTVLNAYTPPAEVRHLLPAEVVDACEKVDALRARIEDAAARRAHYGPKAERPDHHHMEAVRAAVAAGGSSADVPDDRAAWAEAYRQAQEDGKALTPLMDVAWRDLRDTLRAHAGAIAAAAEPVITEAATRYADALDAAEQAEADHRTAMTLRKWAGTADRDSGPDGFKASRQAEVTAGKLTATAGQALDLLRADAAALATLHERERRARARREREARIAAERKAAADERNRREVEALELHAAQRRARLEKERAATAAAEAAAIPGVTPA